jgi:FkbM family methyltransferase
MHWKLYLGRLVSQLGWDMRPLCKVPAVTADLVGVGMALLRRKCVGDTNKIVQAGAFDGDSSDPLRPYLSAADVEAVLVEPQEQPFLKLSKCYAGSQRIRTIRTAIADYDGELEMWAPDRTQGSVIASSNKNHARRFGGNCDTLVSFTVRCVTAATLLEKVEWSRADFLQVDVEGADWEVVQ